MSFLAPAGLFALFALPAVVALHLFRRRLTERRIAGLFLWPRQSLAAAAGRKRTRLLRSPSLWCELLLALALGLWLGTPSLGLAEATPHLVVVLDDSASMTALAAGNDARAKACAAVRTAVAALPGGGQVTLIASGPRPEILLGPAAPRALLEEALARWQPRRPHHDLLPALQLGHELVTRAEDRLLLVTDAAQPRALPAYAVASIGTALANRAIVAARRQREGGLEHLFVDVAAYGGTPQDVELRVLAADTAASELLRTRLALRPREVAHAALRLPASNAPLRLVLPPDALQLDDEVLLLPETVPPLAYTCLLPEETVTSLRLERLLGLLPGVHKAAVADAALVFTAAAGKLRPLTTEVVIAPLGDRTKPDDWIGPYLIERRHPLGEGLALDGVVWSAGSGSAPGWPFVLAGEHPLASEEAETDGLRIWLNLLPERSNLAAAPDWPILVQNLVERARAQLPGPQRANLRIGEPIVYRTRPDPAATRRPELATPGGQRLPARGLTQLSWEAREPGLHRLLAGEQELARWSVAFVDPRESDLTTRGSAQVAASEGIRANAAQPVRSGRTEGRALALLGLLALVLDWHFLRRRGGGA